MFCKKKKEREKEDVETGTVSSQESQRVEGKLGCI
jgi:hypothetical protein